MPDHFTDGDLATLSAPTKSPGDVLKHIDSTFESFFYKRNYTERNFSFYLQVLAQQYKPTEADQAFETMIALDIKPTDYTFTQLMLAHAKKGNLDRVLAIEQEASNKYKIMPSVHRLNSVLMAYAKQGKVQEAEAFVREMKQ